MALTPAKLKRSTDTTGDEILTLTTPGGEHVQGVALVDAAGTQAGIAANPLPVSGTVAISNLPETQAVSGPLTDDELRATAVPISGSVEVSNFPAPPATQEVSGSVAISNLPATQPVSGTVAVSNLPATQPVSGTVNIGNLPGTQPVSGTVTVASLDNTVLFANTITALGPGAALNMTGYAILSLQLSGTWTGSLTFESSNDGNVWDTVLIHSRDDVALQDIVDSNGLYSVRASGKYLRYNVTNLTGTISAVLLGKTIDALSPADKLSFAMDKQLGMPLFVETANPGLRDVNQAAIASDAPVPILFTSLNVANKPLIIDTAGYSSIVIHSLTAGIITPTTSHDGLNWVSMAGVTATAPQTQVATCAAAGMHIFPCTGRFVKLTGPATLVAALVYLRTLQAIPNVVVASPFTVNAGVSAMTAVGGNIAHGTAPTANPVQIGGVDAGRLNTPGAVAANLTPKTRRLLVDEQGRLIAPNVDLTTHLSFENSAVAYVRDVAQHEGQSLIEIMAHILVELRTLNFQIHELPFAIGASTLQGADDLDEVRAAMKEYNYSN